MGELPRTSVAWRLLGLSNGQNEGSVSSVLDALRNLGEDTNSSIAHALPRNIRTVVDQVSINLLQWQSYSGPFEDRLFTSLQLRMKVQSSSPSSLPGMSGMNVRS
jgi:hypothetical protein